MEGWAKMLRVERDVAKYKWEMDKWNETYNDDGSVKSEIDPEKTLLGNVIEGLEYGYETLENYFAPATKFRNDNRLHEPVLYDIVHTKTFLIEISQIKSSIEWKWWARLFSMWKS